MRIYYLGLLLWVTIVNAANTGENFREVRVVTRIQLRDKRYNNALIKKIESRIEALCQELCTYKDVLEVDAEIQDIRYIDVDDYEGE